MNTPGCPALELRRVTLANPRDPARVVVEGLDWSVAAGECWVVAGPEGSGKTALLEAVAGLQPAVRGEVRLLGEPLAGVASETLAALRQRLGVVFEGGGRLFPSLSVAENIALPLRYHRNLDLVEAWPRVAELLAALGLESVAGLSPGRLGRAWARRVALARALVLQPDLLLLDNPLAGLDPAHGRWWRGFLQSLQEGSPLLGGRRPAILLTGDELRPCLPVGQRFAVLHERGWQVLGDRAAVEAGRAAGRHAMLFDND